MSALVAAAKRPSIVSNATGQESGLPGFTPVSTKSALERESVFALSAAEQASFKPRHNEAILRPHSANRNALNWLPCFRLRRSNATNRSEVGRQRGSLRFEVVRVASGGSNRRATPGRAAPQQQSICPICSPQARSDSRLVHTVLATTATDCNPRAVEVPQPSRGQSGPVIHSDCRCCDEARRLIPHTSALTH
jgi:hypothetical protein